MLYHYTSFETLLAILEGITVRNNEHYLYLHATRIDKLNDPTEMEMKKKTLVGLLRYYEEQNNVEEKYQLAKYVEEISDNDIVGISQSEKTSHSPYILCFSTKKDYLPMWSLYGDKHHGVCLCFPDEVVGEISYSEVPIVSGKVAYSNIKKSEAIKTALWLQYNIIKKEGNMGKIKDITADIITEISPFIKNSSYKYEQEFRLSVHNYHTNRELCRTSYENTPNYLTIDIPVRFLQGIILGAKIPFNITKELLDAYFKKKNMKIDIKPSNIPFI